MDQIILGNAWKSERRKERSKPSVTSNFRSWAVKEEKLLRNGAANDLGEYEKLDLQKSIEYGVSIREELLSLRNGHKRIIK